MIKKKRKSKLTKVLLVIVIAVAVFLLYNNLDLSKKRDYVYFSNITINNQVINYSSNIIKGAEPIFLARGDKAVLLLHGGGGTPIELRDLAYYLADRNITVFVPLLDDQGRTYDDLEKINSDDLYNETVGYVNILKKNYSKVYVGGLSTGGSLSLKIGETQNVSGIITLAAPIVYGLDFLGDSTYYFFRIMDYITPNFRRIEFGLAKDPSVAGKLPSFDRLPTTLFIQLEDLKMDTASSLNKINVPIIILQSKFDNRAAPVSADYIYNNVNSSIKNIVWLNNSGHIITMDYDKATVFKEVYNFIEKN